MPSKRDSLDRAVTDMYRNESQLAKLEGSDLNDESDIYGNAGFCCPHFKKADEGRV